MFHTPNENEIRKGDSIKVAMNTERPKDGIKEGEIAPEVTIVMPEHELSEDEQQTARENASREKFIQDWVMSSALTPEQKGIVADYVNTKPGAWREYNGSDFKVVEARVEGGAWKVSFGVFFDDYEAQRIEVDIPLSK